MRFFTYKTKQNVPWKKLRRPSELHFYTWRALRRPAPDSEATLTRPWTNKLNTTTVVLTVVCIGAGLVEVGHGVVRVVLVFPPSHAEPLHHVAPEHASEIAVRSVLEHLQNKT